jgi:hypothetical protein
MAVLTDGFSTKVSFSLDATVLFYEKTVKPPGFTGDGAINTTTMRNTTLRTQAPKSLYSATTSTVTVAYDPACIDEIKTMILQNQNITHTFPDNSTLAWYGWIESFEPNDLEEGDQPTAELTLEPSNTNAGVETAPVYTAAP